MTKPREQFIECLPIFNALGDQTRQAILFLINEEKGLNVLQIATKIGLSRPAVSHHLRVLQDAGIIDHRKVGRERIYYFSFENALKKMSRLVHSVETSWQSPKTNPST